MSKSENNIPIYEKDLCFIDIETTGTLVGFHEVIEVAVIRTCPSAKEVRFRFCGRLAPQFPERVTATAQKINGFCKEMWRGEIPSREFWQAIAGRVGGTVPICHNPSFERAFISLAAAGCEVLDLRLDYHWIGTESLAWPLVKTQNLERFSLDGLCQHLGIPSEPQPHSAITGADACLRVYQRLMEMHAAHLFHTQAT